MRLEVHLQVTRPRIVEDLVERCVPAPNTPGLTIRDLRVNDADNFLRDAIDPDRKSALIVVSATSQGEYLINVDRLRSLTLGLAQLFVIPEHEDTRSLENILTRQYAAYGGAVNIIFPVSRNRQFREAHRYIPLQIEEMRDDGRSVETEILSTVTFRLNLPHARTRISPYVVADAKFRQQLDETAQRAKESELRLNELAKSQESELTQVKAALAEKTGELNDFLELTQQEIATKDREIDALKAELAALHETVGDLTKSVRGLDAANDAMKFSLQGIQSSKASAQAADIGGPLRDAMATLLTDGLSTVEDMLRAVATLYPERIVVLETAFKSARASSMFKNPQRVLVLLLNLAREYWQMLHDGQGDSEARKVFGTAYASKESEVLKTAALKRRTFTYTRFTS